MYQLFGHVLFKKVEPLIGQTNHHKSLPETCLQTDWFVKQSSRLDVSKRRRHFRVSVPFEGFEPSI